MVEGHPAVIPGVDAAEIDDQEVGGKRFGLGRNFLRHHLRCIVDLKIGLQHPEGMLPPELLRIGHVYLLSRHKTVQ